MLVQPGAASTSLMYCVIRVRLRRSRPLGGCGKGPPCRLADRLHGIGVEAHRLLPTGLLLLNLVGLHRDDGGDDLHDESGDDARNGGNITGGDAGPRPSIGLLHPG